MKKILAFTAFAASLSMVPFAYAQGKGEMRLDRLMNPEYKECVKVDENDLAEIYNCSYMERSCYIFNPEPDRTFDTIFEELGIDEKVYVTVPFIDNQYGPSALIGTLTNDSNMRHVWMFPVGTNKLCHTHDIHRILKE